MLNYLFRTTERVPLLLLLLLLLLFSKANIVLSVVLTIPVSPPLIVTSRLQFLSAKPMRLIIIAVMAPPAPETVIAEHEIWIKLIRKNGREILVQYNQ